MTAVTWAAALAALGAVMIPPHAPDPNRPAARLDIQSEKWEDSGMSRTRRKHMTEKNWREARRGRASYKRAQAAGDAVHDSNPITADAYDAARAAEAAALGIEWGTRHTRGGMLMSSHNTGFWNDETLNDRDKRAVKRSERQKVAREAAEEAEARHDLAPDEADLLDHVNGDEAPVLRHVSAPDDLSYTDCMACGRFACTCGMILGEDY